MANIERQKNGGEIFGKRVKYVGVVIGILGLLAEAPLLFIGGAGLAASGTLFENANKKPQQK